MKRRKKKQPLMTVGNPLGLFHHRLADIVINDTRWAVAVYRYDKQDSRRAELGRAWETFRIKVWETSGQKMRWCNFWLSFDPHSGKLYRHAKTTAVDGNYWKRMRTWDIPVLWHDGEPIEKTTAGKLLAAQVELRMQEFYASGVDFDQLFS